MNIGCATLYLHMDIEKAAQKQGWANELRNMKRLSSNSSEKLFLNILLFQRKCSSVEELLLLRLFLSSATPLSLLFLLLYLLLDQIGCTLNPSLCSLDGDQPIPCAWCINPLLADLNRCA